jgi:hypothetical protein
MVLFLAASLSLAAQTTAVMPLDQIKAGQMGKGRTVFEENKIEEFDAEILGVLTNVQPKRSIILARLRGGKLETAGVIAGMSGSPIYIDGKLAGAVAYSFPYAKEAVAGITPIGEMLSLVREKPQTEPPSGTAIPFTSSLSLDDLFELRRDVLIPPAESLIADGRTLSPLKIPLVFGGFSSRIMEKAGPFFSRLGFQPVRSGATGGQASGETASEPALRSGDPVTVQLVTGDLDLSAVGTVTYVDGNKVFAFGHPLYNLGPVDYGMAKAKILTVVASLDSSFKLAATGDTIGAFIQDRTGGALGEVGRTPHLVPLNVQMLGEGGEIREFHVNLVNDTILTPLLVNMSLQTILGSEDRSVGDLSLAFDSHIYLDNGQSVHLEDLFSGSFDSAAIDLSGLMTAVVYFLTSNEFQSVGIHRLDVAVRSEERPRLASLERVWLDKYEASPGEPISVKVYFRTFRGERQVEEVSLFAPNLPLGSEFQLIVGDAASMHQVETSQYRSAGIVPRSLGQIIRLLNNLRKNSRIYFKIIASKPGLFLKGEEMPNLPPAMKSLFASPRAAASSPTELTLSTLGEFQIPIPYVFRGLAVIPIRIRK